MNKKNNDERILRLEEHMKTLREHHIRRESELALIHMGNRITNHLLKLGPNKVDLRLIAKLNVALGIDVMPLSEAAPKKVRRFAKTGKR